MDQQAIDELKDDYRSWSGGFPPGSIHEVTVYVDYALASSIDSMEARELLVNWMNAGDQGAYS